MAFERRVLGDDIYVLVETSLEDDGFLAAFTERTGGASEEPRFASLDLSYLAGDDPARVRENRARVARALGTGPLTVGGQVHGMRIAAVGSREAGRGYKGPEDVIADTDGLYTDLPGVALAVATADCVPVVLASADEGRIAVIHAGWRGIAAGIVERAAALFEQPREARVAVGPSARPCCYEVDEAVVLAVVGSGRREAASRQEGGRLYLDLPGTIGGVLSELGFGRVEDARACTIHEAERFFSHRRQRACGRQMAIGMRFA